jgi:hypothetical protein
MTMERKPLRRRSIDGPRTPHIQFRAKTPASMVAHLLWSQASRDMARDPARIVLARESARKPIISCDVAQLRRTVTVLKRKRLTLADVTIAWASAGRSGVSLWLSPTQRFVPDPAMTVGEFWDHIVAGTSNTDGA